MYIAVELERSGRCAADSNRYYTYFIKNIVEVVASVRTNCHIRCIEAHVAVFIERVSSLWIYYAFILPVTEIVYWSRPAYIVTKTEGLAAIDIV